MFNGDTPISTHFHSDFSPSSEVATTWQTDGAAHKLKPRSFHKSAHLWVHSADFYPSVNRAWHQVNDIVNGQSKPKPRIRMTTKGPSRKNIIIPMSSDNASSFMRNSSLNVANINRELRNARTDILVDYIKSDNTGIIVTTNKVAQQSDLAIINRYVKNSNDINSLQAEDPRLPKSKSYLKIIGIPFYPHADSQEKLSSSDIENVLKQNHIFDNISLASRPRIIKVTPKSDMAIV